MKGRHPFCLATLIAASVAFFAACSDDEPGATCGNGVLEPGEVCDGSALGGETCFTRTGLSHGELGCRADCQGFDTSGCHTCGNDVLEGPEVCEEGELGGETCESQGFPGGGELECGADCRSFDTSFCDPCGNGVADPGEECDGADLGGATCESLGFTGGSLGCQAYCLFDVSECTGCGNGVREAGEACDGADVGTATCASETSHASGTLGCTASCAIDASGCYTCGDGVCAPPEAAGACPEDCACTEAQVGGTIHGYLISSVYIPTTSQEAASIGLDLDGDQTIDNKMGSICSLMGSQGAGDPNTELAALLAAGDLVIIGRLGVDAFPADPLVLGQLHGGTVAGGVPAFDGNDQVTLDGALPAGQGACGDLSAGMVDVAGGEFHFPVPVCFFPTASFIRMPLRLAGLQGTTTAAGWTDVHLGGGIARADVDTYILPQWVVEMNAIIAADPTGTAAGTLLDLLDDACEPTLSGCSPQPAGCAPDGQIALDELRCNALLNAMFAPDVDSDGDGTNDLISVGLRLSAVAATITP